MKLNPCFNSLKVRLDDLRYNQIVCIHVRTYMYILVMNQITCMCTYVRTYVSECHQTPVSMCMYNTAHVELKHESLIAHKSSALDSRAAGAIW